MGLGGGCLPWRAGLFCVWRELELIFFFFFKSQSVSGLSSLNKKSIQFRDIRNKAERDGLGQGHPGGVGGEDKIFIFKLVWNHSCSFLLLYSQRTLSLQNSSITNVT